MVVPWGAIASFIVGHPEMGWVILFGWLAFELRSKRGRIYQLDKKITGAIIVVRAIAQQEEAIDEDKVDDYLAENGMEPHDFFDAPGAAAKVVEGSAEGLEETLRADEDNTPNNDERSTE